MGIQLRVKPSWPIIVAGTGGVTVAQSGGRATVGFDYTNSELGSQLQQSVDSATTQATNAATSATNAATSATNAASSASAAASSASSSADKITYLATRSAVSTFDHTTVTTIFLTEAGYQGTYSWSSANLSAQITADPSQYNYIAPSTDTTGATGAWVRNSTDTKYVSYTRSETGAVARTLAEVISDAAVNVRDFGADPTLTDNAAKIAAAVAALPNGGTIYIPPGRYQCATAPISLTNDYKRLHFMGAGSMNATSPGAGNSSLVLTSATSTDSLIKLDGCGGVRFSHLNFEYSTNTYAGNLIDLRQVAGNINTGFVVFDDFRIGGSDGSHRSATLVRASKTVKTAFYHGYITNGDYGIVGAVSAGDFCNLMIIEDVWFNGYLNLPLVVGGQSWHIRNNVFEPPHLDANSAAAALFLSPEGVDACTVEGNNFADAQSLDGNGAWIDFLNANDFGTPGTAKGLNIIGNMFQGGAFAILPGRINGMAVFGNFFNGSFQSSVVGFIDDCSNVKSFVGGGNSFDTSSGVGAGKLLQGTVPLSGWAEDNGSILLFGAPTTNPGAGSGKIWSNSGVLTLA